MYNNIYNFCDFDYICDYNYKLNIIIYFYSKALYKTAKNSYVHRG